MSNYIGVRFQSLGKIYYFSLPPDTDVTEGTYVIVETVRGIECGTVAILRDNLPELAGSEIAVIPIIRVANEKDQKILALNRKREEEAVVICNEKIAQHNLSMSLVNVECTFDNNKLLFYFTAENRVDFRELVKDLAAVFRTRIELRQIGVRDEAKMLGGLGICGRSFCCGSFLGEFQPVSIKMAKEQGLSLNPTKISGTCGRLMCCLKYEQDVYEMLQKEMPRVGYFVETKDGHGVIEEVSLMSGKVKVRLDKQPQEGVSILTSYDVADVKTLRSQVNSEQHGMKKNPAHNQEHNGNDLDVQGSAL